MSFVTQRLLSTLVLPTLCSTSRLRNFLRMDGGEQPD
jgi:hypothetical protein